MSIPAARNNYFIYNVIAVCVVSVQDAIQKLAKDAVKRIKGAKVVGLGSGSTVTQIVREMAKLPAKASMEFIPSSLQIRLEAEQCELKLGDEARISDIDIVFDGADQIDCKFNMIKGGGGALFREKILISAAKQVVIAADASKFVQSFSRPVPIEVHPMARTTVGKTLSEMGGMPVLRTLEKGYPFVTENGNIVYDTAFARLYEPKTKEIELKSIPGVIEVGLFTRRADVYYRAKSDGTFDSITF